MIEQPDWEKPRDAWSDPRTYHAPTGITTNSPRASLPTDAAARKAAPMAEGLLWYFPNALAAVAAVSKAGNDQHNPGQPMHHSRGKSSDHADCILRHLIDAGTLDTDGQRHTAKVAWRALALLQEEIEREEGVPLPRNAWLAISPAQALDKVSMEPPIMAHHAIDAPMAPAMEELIARSESDDPQVGSLKAGEALEAAP